MDDRSPPRQALDHATPRHRDTATAVVLPDFAKAVRILVVAEAANPELTSVPLVGWSMFQALARRCDAHLVTELRNAPAVARAGLPAAAWTPIDNRLLQGSAWHLAKWLRRGNTSLGWSLYTGLATLVHPGFEAAVWRRFGREIRAGRWDVVHRVTPVTPVAPSPLATWCRRAGVPFVAGPVNGGWPWPRQFPELAAAEGDRFRDLRALARLMPGRARAWRDAAAVLGGSRRVLAELAPWARGRRFLLAENAIDPQRIPPSPPRPRPPGAPLRLAFVGRLVPLKGVDLLLEAAAPLLRSGQASLLLIGDGPQRAALTALATRLGINAQVEFAGHLPHDAVAARLADAHVFAFPSLREFGGGAVLEAMACGLAPVVVDYGGPPELLPPGGGIAVPLGPRAALIAAFGAALTGLADDEGKRLGMAHLAFAHAWARFTWDAKAAQLLTLYAWLLHRGARPGWDLQHAAGG